MRTRGAVLFDAPGAWEIVDIDVEAPRQNAALRVSELLAIRRPDLNFDNDQGVIVTLPRAKGANHRVPVPITANPSSRWDPVTHLQTWLNHLDETAHGFAGDVVWARATKIGSIRHPPAAITAPKSIYTIIANRTRNAGLTNPTEKDDDTDGRTSRYSPHSLRAGFITEAKNRGIDEADIMRHTRHKSLSVMRSYDRDTRHWHRNASDFTP